MGNLVINEYRKDGEEVKEYVDFVNNIFKQIIKSLPQNESRYKNLSFIYQPTEDILLSDLRDIVYDSVTEFYQDYRKSVFCEILAEKIANKNYPIIKFDNANSLDNLLAKNLYFEILSYKDNDFVRLNADKIDKEIEKLKKNIV